MEKFVLFLDDSAERAAVQFQRWPDAKRERTLWVENASSAIDAIDKLRGKFDEIHLDHDLGGMTYVHSGNENTGMEVVRWFEKLSIEDLSAFDHTYFVVHSWNIPANNSMTKRLKELVLRVISRPFGN